VADIGAEPGIPRLVNAKRCTARRARTGSSRLDAPLTPPEPGTLAFIGRGRRAGRSVDGGNQLTLGPPSAPVRLGISPASSRSYVVRGTCRAAEPLAAAFHVANAARALWSGAAAVYSSRRAKGEFRKTTSRGMAPRKDFFERPLRFGFF
jgi:hypothetical protein